MTVEPPVSVGSRGCVWHGRQQWLTTRVRGGTLIDCTPDDVGARHTVQQHAAQVVRRGLLDWLVVEIVIADTETALGCCARVWWMVASRVLCVMAPCLGLGAVAAVGWCEGSGGEEVRYSPVVSGWRVLRPSLQAHTRGRAWQQLGGTLACWGDVCMVMLLPQQLALLFSSHVQLGMCAMCEQPAPAERWQQD